MCDVTHHNSFGPVLTDVDEGSRHILYIVDDILKLLKQCVYNILCMILSFLFLVYLPLLVFNRVISPYPVKSSRHKSEYLFESDNN